MKKLLTLIGTLAAAMELAAQTTIPGVNGPVYAIKMYKTAYQCGNQCCELTQLIVGGQFSQAGSVAVNNIARWNGSTWEPLGTGVNGAVYAIEAVAQFPGDPSPDIYVGGVFTDKGNTLARWNGASGTWSALGTGISSTGFGSLYNPSYVTVRSIKLIGGAVWVGGRFYSAGSAISPNLAKWDLATSQWQGVGNSTLYCDGSVRNGAGINSPLVMVMSIDPGGSAVGLLRNSVPSQPFAPFNPADGEGFYTFNGTTFFGQCRSLVMRAVSTAAGTFAGQDQIIPPAWAPATWENTTGAYSGLSELAGAWQLLGQGAPALPPANGSPWQPAGTTASGWKPLGPVHAIISHNGETYFGGSFTTLSGAYPGQQIADYGSINNIFKWNPATGWSRLQNLPGSCSVAGAIGVNGPVYAMDVDFNACNGQFRGIWVGGSFSDAGAVVVSNIAFWDGTHWSAPGNQGPLAAVSSLEYAEQFMTGPNGSTRLIGLLIDAYTCDPDGSLAGIDFYADGVFIGSAFDLNDPLGFWQPSEAKTYQLTVVARDDQGVSRTSPAFPYAVTDPPPAPTAPTGLTLTVLSATEVRLTWSDNSIHERGYYVERSVDGVNFTRIATLDWNIATFTDSGLQTDTLYYYRVQAFHTGKASAYSNVASILNNPYLCVSKLQDGTESGTKMRFRIARRAADFQSITASFTLGGSATSDSDYDPIGNTAVIPGGAVSVDVELTPLEDTVYEGTETTTLYLLAGSGYTVGPGCSTATATLADNEPLPTVSVSPAQTASEGGLNGYFYFVPSVTIQYPLTVAFSVGGTASPGVDYSSLGGYFTIPGGTSGGSYAAQTVSPINDSLYEGTENVVLTLNASSAYNIGTGSATLKILDDEMQTIYISATDPSASESGGNTGQFTITREGGSASAQSNPLTIPVSFSGSATTGTDYQTPPASVTIPGNQVSATLIITPINDAVYEGAETIVATVSSPNQSVSVGSGQATVNLADDEPLPTVSVSAYQHGAEGGSSAYIVFYLNVAIERSLTIYYSLSGTAAQNVDYTGPTGTYILSGPRSQGSYNGPAINIVDDTLYEGTETVTYTVQPSSSYIVSTTAGSATANITDND